MNSGAERKAVGGGLFGSAIAQVEQQAAPMAGTCVQVPAKKGRRSVFERLTRGAAAKTRSGSLEVSSAPEEEDEAMPATEATKNGDQVMIVEPSIRSDGTLASRGGRRCVLSDSAAGSRRVGPYAGGGEGPRKNRRAGAVPRLARIVRASSCDRRPSGRVGGRRNLLQAAIHEAHGEGGRKIVLETTSGAAGRWSHDMYSGGPDIAGSRVFVRNLPNGCSRRQVESLFASAGEVLVVSIDKGPLTTAIVGFRRREIAEEAVRRFNGSILDGMRIKVAEMEESKTSSSLSPSRQVALEQTSESRPASFLPSDAPRKSIFMRLDG